MMTKISKIVFDVITKTKFVLQVHEIEYMDNAAVLKALIRY